MVQIRVYCWFTGGTLLQKRTFVSDYLPLAQYDHTVIGVT
jgi:hypothetical protein